MIVQRSRNAERVMVFDVKQFKSLEGFLESGPQFVLQAYILLRNPLEEGSVLILHAVFVHCKLFIAATGYTNLNSNFHFRSN